jgi:hypothetical protein
MLRLKKRGAASWEDWDFIDVEQQSRIVQSIAEWARTGGYHGYLGIAVNLVIAECGVEAFANS